jgi:hypothetical protein
MGKIAVAAARRPASSVASLASISKVLPTRELSGRQLLVTYGGDDRVR